MDLSTLAAVNMVIGLFTFIYLGIEFRRNKVNMYLLDFSLAGLSILLHSFIAVIREHAQLPHFVLPNFVNTLTVVANLFVLSALFRFFQLPLKRIYLMLVALVTYIAFFFPLFQQDHFSRIVLGFSIIIFINLFCLRMLFTIQLEKFRSVITFFKCMMFFNITQMSLRGGLFVTEKFGFTAPKPNEFVYQLGWFSLTIFAALVLTGGLIILSRQRQLELEVQAERDPMTGLLNRYTMQNRLNAELNRCQRDHKLLICRQN